MVVSALKPCIVTLIKNMNGNHVAQRCLQYLMPEYSEVRDTSFFWSELLWHLEGFFFFFFNSGNLSSLLYFPKPFKHLYEEASLTLVLTLNLVLQAFETKKREVKLVDTCYFK